MKEENLIQVSELKEELADCATNILLDENLISGEDLSGLIVQFAYLFKNAEKKAEALIMLTTKSEKQFFFRIKNSQMQKVRADEAAFRREKQRVEQYFEACPDARPAETDAQKRRKQENLAWLRAHEIACSETLPCRYEDSQAAVKELAEIRKRAVASFVAIQFACDIQNGRYEDSKTFFAPLLDSGVRGLLNEKELRVVDNSGTPQDALDISWTYERYWVLCWYLGLVEDIRDAEDICDCNKAISLFQVFLSPDAFQQSCSSRSLKELLDLEDLYFRYHWACAEHLANPDAGIGDLYPPVVQERRTALEWLLSTEADWNALTLSA